MAVPSNDNTNAAAVTTATADDENDVMDLTEGLLLLTRFASLDSVTYQASIAFSGSQCSNHNNEECKEEEVSPEVEKHRQTLQRLEHLQAQKNVQNTHLPALWRALHRLHSNLAILQENESKHAAEVRQLRNDLNVAVRDKSKLRKACKLLTEQNGLLKRKLLEKRALLKQARDVFRSSQELQKDLEQQNAAFKLQAHEQFLMQSASRMRLGSTDSNFSDADALLFPDNSSLFDHSGPPTASERSSGRALLPEDDDLVSLHSANSSITDEGVVPVLKLVTHNDDLVTSSATVNTMNSSHVSDTSVLSDENNLAENHEKSCNLPGGPLKHPASPRQPEAYKLWFPFGEKIALRFQTIPLSELPLPPKGVLTQEFLEGDDETPPQATTATSSEGDDETSKQKKLKGQAFVVAAYENTADGAEEQPRPTLGARVMEVNGQPVNPEWNLWQFLDTLKHASGVVHRHRNSESSKSQTDAASKAETPKASLNNSSKKLQEASSSDDEKSASSSSVDEKKKHQTFSISFRNDALTKKQRERLSTPSSSSSDKTAHKQRERMGSYDRVEKQQRERLPSVDEIDEDLQLPKDSKKSSSSASTKPKEPVAFGLGFLRLGGGSNHNKDEEKKRDSPKEGQDKETEEPEEGRDKKPSASSTKETQPKQPKGKNPLFFWDRGEKEGKEAKDGKSKAADDKNEAAKADEKPDTEAPLEKPENETNLPKQEENETATTKEEQPLPDTQAVIDDDEENGGTNKAPKTPEQEEENESKDSADNGENNEGTTEQQAEKNESNKKPKQQDVEKENDRGSVTTNKTGKPPLAPKTGGGGGEERRSHFGLPFWRTSPKPQEQQKPKVEPDTLEGLDPLL